jgi:hypothetical protein
MDSISKMGSRTVSRLKLWVVWRTEESNQFPTFYILLSGPLCILLSIPKRSCQLRANICNIRPTCLKWCHRRPLHGPNRDVQKQQLGQDRGYRRKENIQNSRLPRGEAARRVCRSLTPRSSSTAATRRDKWYQRCSFLGT